MSPELTGRRILLVEDELLISCLLEDMLEDLGCTLVGPASRIDQALRLVAAEAIDAVILDVSLDEQLSYPVRARASAWASHRRRRMPQPRSAQRSAPMEKPRRCR